MIKIENLTKIYTNGKKTVTALNNINISFEDKGLVFITGKSGSGKSTLLNMIGGFDDLTSGNVICEGNNFTNFKEKDFNTFRNVYSGFICQDSYLIDELNVYQNIEVALYIYGFDFNEIEKNQLIEDALKTVDLDKEIINRKINELSAGQKQRVAIARTLIKNPRLILADEPTGNLDSTTSDKILTIFKELSKDRLILIISHNNEEAKKYADRIIELSDGSVVSDKTRNNNYSNCFSFNNGILTLPADKYLTKQQLFEINEMLKKVNVTSINQSEPEFLETKSIVEKHRTIKFLPNKIKFKNSFNLSKLFLGKRIIIGFITTFIISLLIFILGLSQSLIKFNELNTLVEVLNDNNESDLLLYKGYYDNNNKLITNRYVEIDEFEIQEIQNSGYTGNIFKLYYDPFPFAHTYILENGKIDDPKNFLYELYQTESMGTLACNEEYLINTFGKYGKLEVLAGNLNDHPEGIIITDFTADSIIALSSGKYLDYESIVGKIHYERAYINAVIKTNYKEKFALTFNTFNNSLINFYEDGNNAFFKNVLSSFQKYYGIAYSINPDFNKDISINPNYLTNLNYATLSTNKTSSYFNSVYIIRNQELNNNEISMDYNLFNKYFGNTYGYYTLDTINSFSPIEITLNNLNGHQNGNSTYKKDLKIVSLFAEDEPFVGGDISFHVSNDFFDEINHESHYVYGLLIDDATQISSFYNILKNNPYSVQSIGYQSIQSIVKIVEVFENFFWLILICISLVSIILLINYVYGNIRKNLLNIGILKFLGATNKLLGITFSFQTLLMGIIISILSTIFLVVLTNPINVTISNKIIEVIATPEIIKLQIISVNPINILINVLLILFITILSCLIPFLKLKNIKPKIIINKKE